MTPDVEPAAASERMRWARPAVVGAADALTIVPMAGAGKLAQFLFDRRDHAWFYVVVAVVIVAAAGGLLAWAYAYCVARGGSFTGGIRADWHGLYIDVSLECIQ